MNPARLGRGLFIFLVFTITAMAFLLSLRVGSLRDTLAAVMAFICIVVLVFFPNRNGHG